MRRTLLAFAASVSAALFAAVLALWVRSEFVGDQWLWYAPDNPDLSRSVTSGNGRVQFGWTDLSAFTGLNPPAGYYRHVPADQGLYPVDGGGPWGLRLPGLSANGSPPVWRAVTVHDAWPLVLSAALPAVWLIRRARRRGRATGLCPSCGYDLIPSPKPVIVILPGDQPQQRPTPPP